MMRVLLVSEEGFSEGRAMSFSLQADQRQHTAALRVQCCHCHSVRRSLCPSRRAHGPGKHSFTALASRQHATLAYSLSCAVPTPASLTKWYFADRRRQQLGQGPLYRGCRADRLGLGCRAQRGRELRLPSRYARATAQGCPLVSLRGSEACNLPTL